MRITRALIYKNQLTQIKGQRAGGFIYDKAWTVSGLVAEPPLTPMLAIDEDGIEAPVRSSVEGPTMMPQQPAGNPGGGAFSSRLAKVKLPLRRVLLLQASLSSQLVAIKDQHYDLMHDSGRHDSPEMVAKRRALHRHPDILSHLWAWWEAAADEYDVDNSGVLEHNECVLTSVIALHYTYCKYSQ
jgi:hypothetical protein